MGMIGVRYNGRMGNQIFQYVFYQYLKTNNKNHTFFFVNPHHAYLTKYFDLGSFENISQGSKVYSLLTRWAPVILPFEEDYIQNIQVPRPVIVKDWKIYKGFFQTDWYMNHIKGDLNLSIKPKYVEAFDRLYGSVFRNDKTVVVHIRRTDYMNYGKRDISLPMEYFKRRLDAIENLDNYKVLFVSDDIEYAKTYFKERANFIYSSNNEIIDFQIIMNADVAIISNSSFAWWAAYLSKKKNTVYAPKNWLGFKIGKEHPKKVMTDKFIWCDVLNP